MKVEEIDSIAYSRIFPKSYIPYNTVEFNILNSNKCEKVEFLLLQEDKVRIGLISGIKNSIMYSPFSAPFSSFSFSEENVTNGLILKALDALELYSLESNRSSMRFTLPPSVYNEHLISKLIYCFYKSSYSAIVDDNHFFYSDDFVKYEEGAVKKGVKYNLKVAERSGLSLKKAGTFQEFSTAYDIIASNKESKGRPLRMTFRQLEEMQKLVDVDYFLVYCNDLPIASAIIYVYSPKIAHIIYWGDMPGNSCYYPMNYLARGVFKYYRDKGIETIDLGTSSENGEPNLGLSNFKEIIGCTASTKFTFIKTL
jgi:hypothetical protein